MLSLRSLGRLGAGLLIAASPGCRCGSSRMEGDAGDPASTSTSTSRAKGGGELDGTTEDGLGDAGNRFRDAEPKVDRDLEGTPDPACTGAEIALASVVVDPRCAITSTRAKKLRALLERDSGAAALRQEANVVGEGHVALRLVNKGGTSLTLPLSFHGKLPAFTALAEDERHTLYELEPPQLALADPGQGSRSHFAGIVLPPGGAAVATIAISPAIARVLGRGAGDRCKDAGAGASADGGPCNVTKLPKGRYVLHVGQLLSDVEAGAPARVTWESSLSPS